MSTIPQALRLRLLGEARERCCLHRRLWYLHGPDFVAEKSDILHVHHVEFRSCGGSDEESNLVPICPTCHALLHDMERRSGDKPIDDNELRGIWQQWKHLAAIVPARIQVGDGPTVASAEVVLGIYNLRVQVAVDARATYSAFRTSVLTATVTTLQNSDPFFPFSRAIRHWHFTSDDAATPDTWLVQPAYGVLATASEAIRLVANVPIAMNRGLHWILSQRLEDRQL